MHERLVIRLRLQCHRLFPGIGTFVGFQVDLEEALALSVILVGFSFLALMLVKGLFHGEVAV